VRRVVPRRGPTLAYGLPDPSWVEARPDPVPARPLAAGDVRLFAIICAWMEGDVIASTVRNALQQGCERVFLVDNDSPDDTVVAAIAAGAELARTFSTERFEEDLRFAIMHEVIDEVSTAQGADHIWWLFLDADEFPHGPAGTTLAEHVFGLDRRFRVVGARVFNHYPTDPPYLVPGEHPLDHQDLCEEAVSPFCSLNHHKHPLIRWDRRGPAIHVGNGFHMASSKRRLIEPERSVFLHHFPFRDEEESRARLTELFEKRTDPDNAAADHMYARYRSFEAVYAQKWDAVDNHLTRDIGVSPRPWSELVDPVDQPVARWY
jgi:hypothetical protein